MTARLPVPGSDDGDWGDILNTFLEVSLNSDGTLLPAAVTAAGAYTKPGGGIPASDLSSAVQTTLAQANSAYVKPGGGIPSTDMTSAVQTSLGLANTSVQSSTTLSGGDLSGTISSPTVAKIQGVSVSTPAGGSSSYLNASGGWSTPAGGGGVTLDSTNTDIQALGSQSAGTSTMAAKADHVHPTTGLVTTSTSLGGDLSGTSTNATVSTIGGHTPVTTSTTLTGGDLSGNLPAPTLAKIQGTTISAPTGGSTSYLNATGGWTTPSGGGNMNTSTYDPAGIAQQVVGTTATQTLTNKSISGSQITSAVANATNAVNAVSATTATTASTVTTIPALSGDVTSSGSSNATTLAKIQGTTISAPAGGTSAFLNASGTWTTPSGGGGVTLDTTVSDIKPDTTTGTAVVGSTGMAADAGHQHALVSHDHSTSAKGGQITPTTALAATGSASSTTYLRGDNTWSTPAGGVTLDSTNTDIQALGSQSAGTSTMAAKADHVHPTTGLVTTSTSLGGDLTGTSGSATVAKLQGTTISTPAGGTSAFLNASGTWTTPGGGGNMNTSTYDPAGIAQQVVGTTATQTLTNKSISGSQITSAVANATNATTATTATTASTVTTIPALTGDVTSSGSSNATTLAKIQGTTISAPAGGTSAFLNASGTWTTPSGGGGSPAITVNTTSITANNTTLSTGQQNEVDTTSGSVSGTLTVTLPTGASSGTLLSVEKVDSTINTVSVTGNIRGVAAQTFVLYGQHETVLFAADSTGSWWITAGHKPLSMLDGRYTPQMPRLLSPLGGTIAGSVSTTPITTTMYARRYIVPCAGSVTDLSIFIESGGGAGVHCTMAVYDTGDTTPGVRTLLGSTASTSMTGAPTYLTMPALSPTVPVKAGQHIDIACMFDATSPVLAADNTSATTTYNTGELPTNFLICAGGATPRLSWGATITYGTVPSTLADGSLTTVAKAFCVIGRIV